MKHAILLSILFTTVSLLSFSQIITKEDSLNAGLTMSSNPTVLAGYGSMKYNYNFTTGNSVANIDRLVLFFGHRFNKKITFFSELEIEDAKVTGGKASGEFSLEQAFLKFNINRSNYLTTGLFIPRIGIINENHLPTTFNGNERPMVETTIIPSTWREIGIGYYGTSERVPGLNYSAALVNGLNASGFTNGTGIRDGKFEGSKASGRSLALTGAVLYYVGNFRMQASAYYGGSTALNPREADSLELKKGLFSTPVALTEANVQYLGKRLSLKALAAFVAIPNADKINRAFANNTPEQLFGAYGEVAYAFWKKDQKTFRVFTRYEMCDMNFKLANNGIENGTIRQHYIVSGFTFIPVQGVIVKMDYTYRLTGDQNPQLVVLPYPQSMPYFKQQHILTLGVGFSF